MRKSIIVIIILFFIMIGTEVSAASGPDVQAVISGKFDKGENIQVLINIKDIKTFYAGDIEYKYDTSVLKVKSIEPGDLISKAGVNKFDAVKKIDEQAGIVRYAFSCMGQIDGFSGTGTFVKINAEVLKKDDKFFISSKPFLKAFDSSYNLKLQICDKDIKELEYNFAGITPPATTPPAENNTGNSSANNNSSGGTNVGDNSAGTNNSGTSGSPAGSISSSSNTSADASTNGKTNSETSAKVDGGKKSESIIQIALDKVLNVLGIDNKKTEEAKQKNNIEQNVETKSQPSGDNPSQPKQDNGTQASSESNKVQSQGKQDNKAMAAATIILVILLGGGGGYFIWKKKRNSSKLTSEQ
ncbi:hypothetical protein JK636_11195 [Clostridium sp. YIM B02515]|uniref:Cohesin domain-containing protein n=1 Tax=Clostridium rhizosphaerae TaxID=2803861 RepID=A0ABS1TAM7_9CLOT|nr:cohesin domain-containing protein [Clostridium rhizosphaerae]MBL4936326.1 hypothetical protein [Clostridium rhizosphaerae]